MSKIKAVLFDLDGTLLDTAEFVFQAYEHTLKSHGFSLLKRKQLASYIGREISAIYKEIAPGGEIKALINAHDSFQSKKMHLIKSFPNVYELVIKLKKIGIKLGVVTSRLRNTKETLEAGNLGGLFDVIISAEDVVHHKPHPETVLLALKRLKVKPSEALLIGDAKPDIQMGKNAKVKTVGVTYGFGGKDIKKSKPDYVIDKIDQVLEILNML